MAAATVSHFTARRLALLLSAPFLLIAYNPAPAFHPLELAGFLLALVGVGGETVADRQLEAHRQGSAGSGTTCRQGLWQYSRHPNYFFEWVIWLGIAGLGLTAPGGWIGLLAPAMILFFILKITGIPPTEAQALKSRGDAYREYQRRTSAFVPWFRRGVPS